MSDPFTNTAVNRDNRISVGPVAFFCTGNLVVNGGFEQGLDGWVTRNVRIVTGKETHSGRKAAGMGAPRFNRRPALLQQDIPVPLGVADQFFMLAFHAGGYKDAPASLRVCLTWLDARSEPLLPAPRIPIQRRALGNASRGKWTAYLMTTDEAPLNAAMVRLALVKGPGRRRRNFLIIDDVLMVAVPPVCFPAPGTRTTRSGDR